MRFILAFAGLLTFLSIGSVAQTPPPDAGASISGRVTIGGKGVEGVTVVARTGSSAFANRTVAKATTDSNGDYKITGLTAGIFMVTPIAKAYVIAARDRFNSPGKDLNVAENEAIKDIDFSLDRGGVITGRVTDSEGRPIIAEIINLTSQSSPGPAPIEMLLPGAKNFTDDRGVYRIYGLAPGNYKVSVGQVAAAGSTAGRGGSGPYIKTFYPGVTDETKATPVEVKEGAETTNVDITPGKAAQGFSASGRVIDAESGEPVPSLFITYQSNAADDEFGGSGFSGTQSDANGNFRIEGVMPGRYTASAMSFGSSSSSYGEPVPFEVVEGDVKGIEIKVRRGSTIEGVVTIENAVDASATNVLKSISLYAFVSGGKGKSAPSFSRSAVNGDGSFRLAGLSPGKAQITVMGFPTPPNGLQLLRTELNGVEQPDGIEVTAGANVTGVRIVFEYGTARIRGEVKVEGGLLPQDAALTATILRAGRPEKFTRFANVDARGRFFFEDMPPGVYEVTITIRSGEVMIKPVSRTVTIGGETEVPVSITIDVSKQGQPQ